MARVRRRPDVAAGPRGDPVVLSFTADSGRELAELAGEALAKRRGNALRPRWRPVHTTGVFVTGSFKAAGVALPHAPAFLRNTSHVAATARFSSCDPRLPANDRRHGPRGLAVRLQLDDGATTDLVAMSTDRFMVSTRGAFVSVARAMRCRVPMRWIRVAWLTTVRQVRAPVTFALAFPPRSYGRLDYYTINTFVWSTDKGEQPVRYRWRPVDGPLAPRPWTRFFKSRRYLDHELAKRLENGSILFSLEVQQPKLEEDVTRARLLDVAKPLPRKIRWTHVAELQLEQIVSGTDATELERMVFSPTHLATGVDVYPDDEIMAARAAAYPASHVARAGGAP
jgi:catalase